MVWKNTLITACKFWRLRQEVMVFVVLQSIARQSKMVWLVKMFTDSSAFSQIVF